MGAYQARCQLLGYLCQVNKGAKPALIVSFNPFVFHIEPCIYSRDEEYIQRQMPEVQWQADLCKQEQNRRESNPRSYVTAGVLGH